MHAANRAYWKRCSQRYPNFFKGDASVLEVGSYCINGTVREHFKKTQQYIGVDWRKGPGVDKVYFAHEMDLGQFDVVISASMLEHDPHWEKSIRNMVKHVKDTGILLLAWGAALNVEHELDTACDGGFHALPAGKVINLLQELDLYIHEFYYEGTLFPKLCITSIGKGVGEVVLMAFKDKSLAKRKQHLDVLYAEDEV